MVDTALELDDGRRVVLCAACGERLAVMLRVGSKATAAVREELEGEIAERDARLDRLAQDLQRTEDRLAQAKEGVDRYMQAYETAQALASQAAGSLQQIGRLT